MKRDLRRDLAFGTFGFQQKAIQIWQRGIKNSISSLTSSLDRIERYVVQSPYQQQRELRQTHADHEQDRAEEHQQGGPYHYQPERGSANHRQYHDGIVRFVLVLLSYMCR